MSARPAFSRSPALEALVVRIRRVMFCTGYVKQKRALTTSATQRPQRPPVSKLKSHDSSSRISLLHRLLAFGVALGTAGQDLLGDQAGVLADRRLDFCGHVGVGLEERLGVLTALAEPLAVIGEPGAGFLDNAGLDAEIENFAHLGDALAIHDVEFDLLERRRQLVLHHLDPGLVADPLVGPLDGAGAAGV